MSGVFVNVNRSSRTGRRPDRGLRHDDGAVPPGPKRRRSGSRGRDVRNHGIVHVGRACQRRHVRPSAGARSSRGRSRRTASRTAPATASFAALIYHDRQWSAPLQTPSALFDDPHLNAVRVLRDAGYRARVGALRRCADVVFADFGPRRGAGPAAGCRHHGGARRTRPGARRRRSRRARFGVARSWRAAAYFGRRRAVSAVDAHYPDLN
jgi:hypothetical protein